MIGCSPWGLGTTRSAGQRKCIGDQFALLEAVVVLSVLFKKYSIELVPGQDIQMTTGATIHTLNGLLMTVKRRSDMESHAQDDTDPAKTVAKTTAL